MTLRDMPIRRKVITIILITSVVVMVLMRGAFFAYEFVTFRQATVRQLSTLGEITAANCTAALAFDNENDANEILSALTAESHVVAACLYDRNGHLFSRYPEGQAADFFPPAPGPQGYKFEHSYLAGFQPVVQGGNRQLGTLYLRFDARAIMSKWLRVSLGIGAVLMALVLLVAYLLSRALQRQITQPILALADTAKAISEHQDYSVRAKKIGEDELGQLTDAFNQMLAQIQELNRELEDRVVQRTAQLQAANQELESFSYSVSHDLRAPLRHIDGFAGLLSKHSKSTLDTKGQHLLDTISGAAKQMGRLIDDLLAFSRTGRTELKLSPVNQDALVAEIIRDGGFARDGRPIEWVVSPMGVVQADAALLRQVWSNLIENAVKYSGKLEHPRIEIGAKPRTAEGEEVFYVRDNGVGFDMKYVDKLFGVFQRLHASSDFEGTGIGLANVRRIVSRHGGRTWAEGVVGEGAAFYFALPAPGQAKEPVAFTSAPHGAASRHLPASATPSKS
jgi:signal transduction histidine kinase